MPVRSHALFILWVSLILAGCTSQPTVQKEQPNVDYDLLLTLPEKKISYNQTIQPILNQRCVVCHGCFDAPCQLKLSSFDGLQRGSSSIKVYDGTRFKAIEPMRLNIDAKNAEEWRVKGFHPILNEGDKDNARSNLEGSVLYYMLRLKQSNPQPRIGKLPQDVDVGLDRQQVCTTAAGFPAFAEKHPMWGMPYGLPNLTNSEYSALVQWIAQGAPGPEEKPVSAEALPQVKKWESFLNDAGNKQQLVSRYLFEHLIQAHIHFTGTPENEFYRLVRSFTPSGRAVEEVPTVRPYDDPGAPFYYRLQRYQPSIVDKDHTPYEWSDARMKRYRELFIEPDYVVATLPGYDSETGANPFKVFEAIPPVSRYQFMLDDAKFFVEGFIKGPVCRGQIAVNVIEDQFWIFFVSPNSDDITLQPEFISDSIDYLNLPAEQGDNSINILATWIDYLKRQKQYLATKNNFLQRLFNDVLDIHHAANIIWNGSGTNRNAALTVFRHYDSASVAYGLVGDYPETAWVIDYPLFERIHYLLVAGFNVYGNVTHQLNTRLYMDFLRMEAENQFLLFMPASRRERIRDTWYQGMQETVWKYFKDSQSVAMTLDTVKGYKTNDPQREFFKIMEHKLGSYIVPPDPINRCELPECEFKTETSEGRIERAMQQIAAMRGEGLAVMPDLSFIHIRNSDGNDQAYTIILNKGYSNITSMFENEDRRDRRQDSLTVVKGLEGSYPNFFFSISLDRLDDFVKRFTTIKSHDDYERFVSLYGVGRTNTDFWKESDWFNAWAQKNDPLAAGIYDYNRYRDQ